MADFDLIVRAKRPHGEPIALGISDGCFAAIGADIAGSAKKEINEPDFLLLPGWIDAHVHFNEPGRADWEGIATGSQALAKGGGSVFFDMPLNSSPPVLTGAGIEEKARVAKEKSCLDFALWGGLTPNSLPFLEEMADAGAIGFKAFMCHSGLDDDEFPASDAETLRRGMEVAAQRNLPVAVHAEVPLPMPPIIEGTDMKAWLDSRPIAMELEAIKLALAIAGETHCALHIVHISCPEGIHLVSEAKAAGINVTAETCPHYLLLDRDLGIAIGAAAKCAPPLRSTKAVAQLRALFNQGAIDTLGSDHSPSPPELKQSSNFFEIWGGIAGIQHGLPLLLAHCPDPSAQISANVARRFGLRSKGGLEIGKDADFALYRRNSSSQVSQDELVTCHAISPYIGMRSEFAMSANYQRGKLKTPESRGHFLTPTP